MKKVTSSILIGLVCTSILTLSTGVQSVKADSQPLIQQSQMLNDEMVPFIVNESDTGWFYGLLANNVVDGHITSKTTTINLKYGYGNKHFYIRDSDNNILKKFTSHDNGGAFDIDVTGIFKDGETYKVTFSENTKKIFSFDVVDGDGDPSNPGDLHAPVVHEPVYEGDTLLKGTGSQIGNEIIVKNIGGAVVGAGTVGLDLEFTVAMLPQPAYSKLYVTETDGTHTSEATEVIVHEAHLKIKS